jgi:hypothetical protein
MQADAATVTMLIALVIGLITGIKMGRRRSSQ